MSNQYQLIYLKLNSKKIVYFFIALFLLINLTACSSNFRKPLLPSTESPEHVYKQVTEQIKTKYNNKILRGLYKAQFERETLFNTDKSTLRYAIVVKNPQSFYLQTLPASGFYALNFIKSNGNNAVFVDNSSKQKIITSNVNSLVSKELGLNIEAKYITSLFLGQIPFDLLEDKTSKLYKISSDSLILVSGIQSSFWEIDSNNYQLKKVEFWQEDSNTINAQVLYDKFVNVDRYSIPSEIVLKLPSYSITLSLSLMQSKLVDRLPSGFFD